MPDHLQSLVVLHRPTVTAPALKRYHPPRLAQRYTKRESLPRSHATKMPLGAVTDREQLETPVPQILPNVASARFLSVPPTRHCLLHSVLGHLDRPAAASNKFARGHTECNRLDFLHFLSVLSRRQTQTLYRRVAESKRTVPHLARPIRSSLAA